MFFAHSPSSLIDEVGCVCVFTSVHDLTETINVLDDNVYEHVNRSHTSIGEQMINIKLSLHCCECKIYSYTIGM